MNKSPIIRQAVELAKAGDKIQARALITSHLLQDPMDADAWIVMAQLVEQRDQAIECVQRALDIRPDDRHARKYLDYLQQQDIHKEERISPLLIGGVAAALLLLCAVGLLLSGRIPGLGGQTQTAATESADCRQIIEQALLISDDNCSSIDTNHVCYGHTVVTAEIAPGTSARFDQEGDILSLESLMGLQAAPMDTGNNQWGVSIFKLEANLPYTVPGQNITMVVAGNTNVSNITGAMQAFTFSSGIGGIRCEGVPADGLVVRMGKGFGIRFRVNNADLALTGNAIMRARTGDRLEISMLDGGGWVSSDGASTYFEGGETASIPMIGHEVSGPPVVSPNTGNLCLVAGTCNSSEPVNTWDDAINVFASAVPESVATIAPTGAAASGGADTPTPVVEASATDAFTVTPGPSPTATKTLPPGVTPTATKTLLPGVNPTATKTLPPGVTPTKTPVPTTSPVPPTNTPVPPTNTPVPPTNTPVPPTNTLEPPTSTPGPTCANVSAGWDQASGKNVKINISNSNASPVILTNVSISWPSSNGALQKINPGNLWSGSAAPTSFSTPLSVSVLGSTMLMFQFENNTASAGYSITVNVDIGCVLTVNQ